MNKPIQLKINSVKYYSVFGSCATYAICGAFDINHDIITKFCKILKLKHWSKGLNFWECKKLINVVAGKNVEYISNKGKITYYQLYILFPKNTFLVDVGNHLSHFENGVIYDNYLDENDIKKRKPKGWWKIK